MSERVMRIDQALRFWEDYYFVHGLLVQHGMWTSVQYGAIPFAGPLMHWHEFRSYLLQVTQDQIFDTTRFEGSDRTRLALGPPAMIPRSLATWTQHSRRVFEVDGELQSLLAAMSFGDVRWNDILFPFKAFAITLDRPLGFRNTGSEQGLEFDAFLVYYDFDPIIGENRLLIGCLSPQLADYRPLGQFGKQEWRKAVSKRKLRVEEIFNEFHSAVDTGLFCWFSVANEHFEKGKLADTDFTNSPVREFLNAEDEQLCLMAELLRIVGGFCLYLMSLPPGSPHRSSWHPPSGRSPDPRAITRETQVCEVSSVFTLSSEERTVFGGNIDSLGRELCTHFRRGHYRRAPGTGNDPDAPRIVLVQPALVRRDRLQPGTQPGGARAISKP